MREDVDYPLFHQRRQTDGAAHIVGEGQERAAVSDQAAVQGDPVHDPAHAMFADPVIQVAPAWRRRLGSWARL